MGQREGRGLALTEGYVFPVTLRARCISRTSGVVFGGNQVPGNVPDGTGHHSAVRTVEALADAGLPVESAAERSSASEFGDIHRTVSIAVFDLGDEAYADAARRTLSELEWYYFGNTVECAGADPNVLLSDSRPLGREQLKFRIWWSFCAYSELGSSIQGFGVYSATRLLFVVWVWEHDSSDVPSRSGQLYQWSEPSRRACHWGGHRLPHEVHLHKRMDDRRFHRCLQ